MHIKTSRDLKKLNIDTNAFNSYYMSNGGCSTCLMKGGAEMVEGEPSNLTAKDFMNHYFPLLRGGYEETKRKEGNKRNEKEEIQLRQVMLQKFFSFNFINSWY